MNCVCKVKKLKVSKVECLANFTSTGSTVFTLTEIFLSRVRFQRDFFVQIRHFEAFRYAIYWLSKVYG